jgi:DNA-binding transcriptional regulator GbsR (MarR family)
MSSEASNPYKDKRMQLRQQVIHAIAETMDLYGVTSSYGELYGVMFFEDRPMTLEEMKIEMNMSKSNMSYAIRSLLDSQMVVKLEEKQQKQNLYLAEADFFRAFQNFLTKSLEREINVMTETINKVMPDLKEFVLAMDTPDEDRQLGLRDLHKLMHAVKYYEWLQKFINKLKRGDYFEEI